MYVDAHGIPSPSPDPIIAPRKHVLYGWNGFSDSAVYQETQNGEGLVGDAAGFWKWIAFYIPGTASSGYTLYDCGVLNTNGHTSYLNSATRVQARAMNGTPLPITISVDSPVAMSGGVNGLLVWYDGSVWHGVLNNGNEASTSLVGYTGPTVSQNTKYGARGNGVAAFSIGTILGACGGDGSYPSAAQVAQVWKDAKGPCNCVPEIPGITDRLWRASEFVYGDGPAYELKGTGENLTTRTAGVQTIDVAPRKFNW